MDQPAVAIVMQTSVVEMIDLAFGLRGSVVAPDYADALCVELQRCLPWLSDTAVAGVHPLTGVSPGEGKLYLSGRSRLILRLPVEREAEARSLSGREFNLGEAIKVDQAVARKLMPSPVLYSSFVACGPVAEFDFLRACGAEIEGLGFASSHLICGKARHATTAAGEHFGFSLMVHGLNVRDSLLLQRVGLGGQRLRGCGIFVQHKSVVAVDD